MKHPFAQETAEKKYAYVMGIAMVVFENGEINTKQEDYLKRLINDIGLTYKDLNKILGVARHYQTIKDKVINVLDTPYKKHCFLMELYSMLYQTGYEDKKLAKEIHQFVELLNITEPGYDIVKQVYMNWIYKNKLYLAEISKKCEEERVFLGEEVFNYFTADESFILQEERVLLKGEELIITKSYKIVGAIKVLEGARLIFDEAQAEIHVPIQVEGGYLEIKNSFFKVSTAMHSAMFNIVNAHVHIVGSGFDGNNATGIWYHAGGELFIENSTFTNTSNRPCITLWECLTSIKRCHFTKCRAEKNSGGALYTNSNLEVLESSFEACSAYEGAAIYRFASVIPWIQEDNSKTLHIAKKQTEESKMIKLFGKKIDFIPIPKSFKHIAYPIILRRNTFLNCETYKSGIVCAYKQQIIIDEKNIFVKCIGQHIGYYE